MREVLLWAQTTQPAAVHFEYWIEDAPDHRFATRTVATTAEGAFTAHAVADSVEPGQRYAYELFIDGARVDRPYPLRFQSQALWWARTEPPNFRFAIGSCAYVLDPAYEPPGPPAGHDYQVFSSIYDKSPDAMLWLGDNVYLREMDWTTRTGILHRYTTNRSLPEMQPLLASASNYAIWDDHDFGPNNADGSFRGKDLTLEAFKLFWANPGYGVPGVDGITTSFVWGDVEFFLLDNRYNRTSNLRVTGTRQILGDAQIEWLTDALASSQATFKIIVIGGQVLSPMARWENYANYSEEQARLISLIEDNQVPGVLFLSGDRHMTALTKLDRPGTYPLYDLTVSPLTTNTVSDSGLDYAENTLMVEGTLIEERNFATLDFSGPLDDRLLRIQVFDVDGAELWHANIRAADLR
jgi:alkaline phosphatase D